MAEHSRFDERQVVVFSLGDEEFGVNVSEVREIIRATAITRLPNTAPFIRGVINLRGSIIIVIDLAMKLMFQSRNSDKDTRIIVVEIAGSTVGMIVDSATEVLRLSSSQIQPPPAIITDRINAHYLEGVAVLGERLLIVLDLVRVLESQEMRMIERLQNGTQEAPMQPMARQENSVGIAPDMPSAPREPHPATQDVPPEYHFITHDGRPLRNVHQLLEYIRDLDQDTFQRFVNEEKNDFYNWITHCVRDKELADRIRALRSKDDVTNELRDRLIHIHLP